MKNHTNECTVVSDGDCICDTPTSDVQKIARLEREAEHYLDVIEDLNKQIGRLQANFNALAEYPWGLPWTYWFTAMTSGAVSIIGWHIGVWILS
jgi:hypothetical protein